MEKIKVDGKQIEVYIDPHLMEEAFKKNPDKSNYIEVMMHSWGMLNERIQAL